MSRRIKLAVLDDGTEITDTHELQSSELKKHTNIKLMLVEEVLETNDEISFYFITSRPAVEKVRIRLWIENGDGWTGWLTDKQLSTYDRTKIHSMMIEETMTYQNAMNYLGWL